MVTIVGLGVGRGAFTVSQRIFASTRDPGSALLGRAKALVACLVRLAIPRASRRRAEDERAAAVNIPGLGKDHALRSFGQVAQYPRIGEVRFQNEPGAGMVSKERAGVC